jgi:hypothetical protein
MGNDKSQLQQLDPDLAAIAQAIKEAAKARQGDSVQLLALLRLLEKTHQEVRETSFQASLPDNRQALYSLLRDIEANGGWPYIYRMKLQSLLSNFINTSDAELLSMMTDGLLPQKPRSPEQIP